MKTFVYILSFVGGVFLAIQAGFNTQLSSITKNSLFAVTVNFAVCAFLGTSILMLKNQFINIITFQKVPFYLWFIGGVFSFLGLLLYFYSIPKIGISKMITLGLCGQIIVSMVAGKYGWFGVKEIIGCKQVLGAITMILGIFLINSK